MRRPPDVQQASTDTIEGQAPRPGRLTAAASRLPHWARQFIKFALVGGSGTLVNLGVFSLIIFVWVKASGHRPLVVELFATAAAFCVAVVSNFTLNRRWTFRHQGPIVQHFGRFFLVSLVGMGLNVLSYAALHGGLGIQEHLSELLAIAIVMPLNFVGSKWWAFR